MSKSYKAFEAKMFTEQTTAEKKGLFLRYIQPQHDAGLKIAATCVDISRGEVIAVWVRNRGIVWEKK